MVPANSFEPEPWLRQQLQKMLLHYIWEHNYIDRAFGTSIPNLAENKNLSNPLNKSKLLDKHTQFCLLMPFAKKEHQNYQNPIH